MWNLLGWRWWKSTALLSCTHSTAYTCVISFLVHQSVLNWCNAEVSFDPRVDRHSHRPLRENSKQGSGGEDTRLFQHREGRIRDSERIFGADVMNIKKTVVGKKVKEIKNDMRESGIELKYKKRVPFTDRLIRRKISKEMWRRRYW